jgi:hypothetical protein
MADILCAGCAGFLQHAVDELDGVTCIFYEPQPHNTSPRIGDPTRIFPFNQPLCSLPATVYPWETMHATGTTVY